MPCFSSGQAGHGCLFKKAFPNVYELLKEILCYIKLIDKIPPVNIEHMGNQAFINFETVAE